jgi:hypothetical protein
MHKFIHLFQFQIVEGSTGHTLSYIRKTCGQLLQLVQGLKMQGNNSKDHSTVDHYIMKGPLVNPVTIMLILDKLGWWKSSINLKPNPLLQN